MEESVCMRGNQFVVPICDYPKPNSKGHGKCRIEVDENPRLVSKTDNEKKNKKK